MNTRKSIVTLLVCAAALVGLAQEEPLSPFDDAVYWFHGGVDSNGNGFLDHNTSEFRDITCAASFCS